MSAGTASGTVVTCPACGKKLKVRNESVGKKVRCPQCKGAIDTGAVVAGQAEKLENARKAMKEGRSTRPGRQQSSFMANSPDFVRAMVIGIVSGAIWGLIGGIIFGILVSVLGLAFGGLTEILSDAVGTATIVLVIGVLVALNVLYYCIFGGVTGIALGLTQNIWAGYGVALLFVVASYFVLGDIGGVISAVLFTGFVIQMINANMAR